MTVRAFITGLGGPDVTADERAVLRDTAPWGLILFKRNIESPDQVGRLTSEFRAIVGRDAPVLVDQEGGRVQRLGPPHWPVYPPGAVFGRLYELNKTQALAAASLGARLMAADMRAIGIDVDCLPVADVPVAASDPMIGDRAYGDTPAQVAALAGAAAEGLLQRRRSAGGQTSSRPWPRDRRQPPGPAGGGYRPRNPGRDAISRPFAPWPACRSA